MTLQTRETVMIAFRLLLLLLLFIPSPVSRRRLAPSVSEAASFMVCRANIRPIWYDRAA
jgi:hypothetical protein